MHSIVDAYLFEVILNEVFTGDLTPVQLQNLNIENNLIEIDFSL